MKITLFSLLISLYAGVSANAQTVVLSTSTQAMTNKTVNGLDPTHFSYLLGITSDVQAQLAARVTNTLFNTFTATMGTLSTQNANSVAITGGSVSVGTLSTSGNFSVSGYAQGFGATHKIGNSFINGTTGNVMDMMYETPSSGFRLSGTGFDGATIQAYGGTHADFPGRMYLDYGSQQRSISGRSLTIRNNNSGSITDVLAFDANGKAKFATQVIILTAGQGVLMKTPDGTGCAVISLDNSKNFVKTDATCP